MYYPYFRGKQFELIAIRESAELIARSGFTPIIEPVRETLTGLEKSLAALAQAGAHAVVVVNPSYGDHKGNGDNIAALLQKEYPTDDAVSPGVLLTSTTTLDEAIELVEKYKYAGVTLVHSGFTWSRELASSAAADLKARNVFIDEYTNLLYRRHYLGGPRILVADGFEQRKNADYPLIESFSDLHVTYRERGMDGFGDFLTVGDNYSEGGGPAYAVAIHLTFIDEDRDNGMYIYHFKSDTNDTPTDPAGKFSQALGKLILKLDSGESYLLETSAITEFRDLHRRGHFPGLGYVKKMSIKHHLETLANYFESSDSA